MALLTQSEAVAFNGFLSSVDFTDVLEWSAVATLADGGIPIPPAPEKGKEAILAKAAKDLMSLESPTILNDNVSSMRSSYDASTMNSSWPSLPGESSEQRRTHSYTYGFGPPSRNSHKIHLPNLNPPGGPSQAIPDNLFSFPPKSHSPARTSSSSPFSFTTNSTSPTIDGRPSPYSSSSTPSVLANQRSSSTKRNLPHDNEPWLDNPNTLDSAKRRRSSAASVTSPVEPKLTPPTRARGTRAPSVSSSAVAGPSTLKTHDESPGSESNGASFSVNSKPTLLSPSQKRANHIQSEQKRRANIRRGYEALCEAVPALREAIKQEEEAARGAEEDGTRTKRKRKGKGAAAAAVAAADESADKVGDGRAGPKSENVVLQKTIDHLHALLATRTALKERLTRARSVLSPNHPALNTSVDHLDEKGVPLWEREWNGGTGWKDGEDEGEDE